VFHSFICNEAFLLTMKIYLSIVLFFLYATFTGCNLSASETLAVSDDHYETIRVPDADSSYTNFDSALNFSDFIILKPDSQINVSSLSDIYSLKRIFFVDGKFFILDIKYMTATAYDMTGKYLYTFNKIGKGAGGSTFLLDLFIDQKEKAAYLISNLPSKLIKYTLDGTLVHEYFPPFHPSSMSKVGDRYHFDLNFNFKRSTGKNNFVTTDTSFNILSRSFSYENEKETSSFLDCGGMFTLNDSLVYYSPGRSNAIYHIEDGSIAASYYFKFLHDSVALDLAKPKLREENENQLLNRLYKYGDYIGFNYNNNKTHKTNLCLYNYGDKHFFKSKTIDLFENALIHQSNDKIIIGVSVKSFYDKLKAKMNLPGTYPAWYEKAIKKMEGEKIDNNTIGIIICSLT
jgi:DNA-binding ferritin-like protein (Dps family)